jgi:DNA-binding MarR family transcriptional regulator
MKHQPIRHQFYLTLLEFLMTAKQHVVAIGAEFDLTSIQAITLLLLDASTPRPMKNFCMLYHCDASNVTGIIDGLETKGLVSRRSDAHDRRIKVIQLEPAGQKMQQHILERLAADSDYLFGPLESAEIQQFVHIVGKLAAANSAGCGEA